MNAAFSKEGSRLLRLAWATLAVAIAAACALAWGGYWYLQKEKRDGVVSKRQLGEAQARLANAKRERDDLRTSSEVFQDLVARGILKEESRLDLLERLHDLKVRHRLLGLEYEIAPQRPLPLAGGRVFNAVDVLGSRVKIKALALHEGDALAFLRGALDAAERIQPGEPLHPSPARGHARRMRRPRASRPSASSSGSRSRTSGGPVRTSLALLFVAFSAAAGAQELGTLFHTAKEREALDRMRRGEPRRAGGVRPSGPGRHRLREAQRREEHRVPRQAALSVPERAGAATARAAAHRALRADSPAAGATDTSRAE